MSYELNPLVVAQEAHRGRREQEYENTARQAWSFSTLNTHGIGQILHTTVVPFDCTFVEEPRIGTGFAMDGDTLIDTKFPTVTAGVWKWHTDYRGYYLGAYVFFVITGDPSYDITHHFTFSGISIKDLDEYLMED